jgi:dihydroxy-acid dehydratase
MVACIGYLSPEALDDGPIAVVENNDLVKIDIPSRTLNIIGVNGVEHTPEGMADIIKARFEKWKAPTFNHKGALLQYTRTARAALKGGSCS